MEQVLYFLDDPGKTSADLAQRALSATARRLSPARARQVRIAFETSVLRSVAKLRMGAADTLIIDARREEGPVEESPSLTLLKLLFEEHEMGSVVWRDRTWIVVSSDARGAAVAFEAGRARLAGAIVGDDDEATWERIWECIASTAFRRHGGKIALCLAGGGTEGLIYELGALRAIADFLPGRSFADVDIVCGISAGAVVGGLLANGVHPDELSSAIRGGKTRLVPLRRSDLFDLDVRGFARRAAALSFDVVRGRRSPLSALFRLPPAGVFAGARLRAWLKKQFNMPYMVDRFEDLACKLFIGATDQDTSEHVVFGAPGAPDVPIHLAVRASAALAPFYAPERIEGRYYIDGGFTRTTNMRVAVQEGATLVLLVDPMVPVLGTRPGQVAERGAVYVAMQGLKSLINGRFDKAVPTLRAMYPHVAFHLFQPGEASRRVMGGSPMRYFYREEIEEIAYRETVRELRRRLPVLARDFGRHGIRFEDPDASAERANIQWAADLAG